VRTWYLLHLWTRCAWGPQQLDFSWGRVNYFHSTPCASNALLISVSQGIYVPPSIPYLCRKLGRGEEMEIEDRGNAFKKAQPKINKQNPNKGPFWPYTMLWIPPDPSALMLAPSIWTPVGNIRARCFLFSGNHLDLD